MKVSPSLLSADFGNLAKDIDMINRSDADLLHRGKSLYLHTVIEEAEERRT